MDYLNKIITVHDCEITIARTGQMVRYDTCVMEVITKESDGYTADLMTGDANDGETIYVSCEMLDSINWTQG